MKLTELLDGRRRELGLSYDQAAEKAESRGFPLSKSVLYGYTSEELAEAPRRRTMEGIAAALDLDYHQVVMAVAESLIGDSLAEMSTNRHILSWLTIASGRSDEEIVSLLGIMRTVAAALDAKTPTPG